MFSSFSLTQLKINKRHFPKAVSFKTAGYDRLLSNICAATSSVKFLRDFRVKTIAQTETNSSYL